MEQVARAIDRGLAITIDYGHTAQDLYSPDRAKGTLQIKVQIRHPDKFLTPELSAKVDFLK